MKRILLVVLLALVSNVQAAIIELDATNSGHYTSSGSRNGNISNVFAGDGYSRNWIAFDLSAIADEILSASLTIYNHGSNHNGINFTWAEVTTSVPEVFTSAGDGMDIYNDLKDGAIFATGIANSGGNDVYSLTPIAISSLNNANGYWMMGGSTASDLGRAYGFTGGVGSGDLIQLTIVTPEITAIPVPAAAWLFISGLLGIVAVSRRRD